MFYALCAWLLCCYVCIAQMQQQELAQMRQREANLTALAAIGPRKKRKILDSPSSSTAAEVTENKIYSPYSHAYPRAAVYNLCPTCHLYGTQNVTHTSKYSVYICIYRDSIKDFFYRNRNVQQSVLLFGWFGHKLSLMHMFTQLMLTWQEPAASHLCCHISRENNKMTQLISCGRVHRSTHVHSQLTLVITNHIWKKAPVTFSQFAETM